MNNAAMSGPVPTPYYPPNAPPNRLEAQQDKPAAIVELDMIANIMGNLADASSRLENALDRLSGGRPQAVQGSAANTAPTANSVLSKLVIVRERLGFLLAEVSDHAARLEKFV